MTIRPIRHRIKSIRGIAHTISPRKLQASRMLTLQRRHLQFLLSKGHGLAGQDQTEEHLIGRRVYLSIAGLHIMTRLVLVVAAIVRALGEVDARAKEAGVGEAHVQAVVRRVNLTWFGVVGAVEEQAGQVPHAGGWVLL